MASEQELLKHFLAAIAYRTQKALREAPVGFADFSAGNHVRTPHELVWHMTGVLGYAITYFRGGVWQPNKLGSFPDEIARFHHTLEDLSEALETKMPIRTISAKQLLQGPLADVMTHAGQLAVLRRLAGSPVPPENFIRARIETGNLGPSQAEPAAPDPGWKPDLPAPAPGKDVPEGW